jgi:uncharacterized protein (DUF4213/DUF364 family)
VTTPENAPAQLAAGVAILNATQQLLTGQMTDAEFAAVVDGEQPADAVRAVAYLGVRIASLFATATDTEVETVLGFLGAEVASLPTGH